MATRSSSRTNFPVLVGMGGWQLESFDKHFFPQNPPRNFRKLRFYSRFFDTVEVNATFYTTALNRKNAERWLDDVADNKEFLFTVKLYKGFTHDFTATEGDVRNVLELLTTLANNNRLAGVVAQFPYSFANDPERRSYLERLAKALREHVLFVEVRHNSWNTPETVAFFRENGLHPVNTDLPHIKRHMPFTNVSLNGLAYYRMMGRNSKTWDRARKTAGAENERYLYKYGLDELSDLVSRIRSLTPPIRRVLVIFHNDPNANSLADGYHIRHIFLPEEKLKAPESLLRAFPVLATFTVVASEEAADQREPMLFPEETS
jgi:uncharacterized protein YecE (DUF72 family)